MYDASNDVPSIELVGTIWGEHVMHHIMRGHSGAKYIIDWRPGDEDQDNVIWIWEHRRGSDHDLVARYKIHGTIGQQVIMLIKLAKNYQGATVRIDLTHAGLAAADIIEDGGVKVETYFTVSHVGKRE